MSEQQFQVGDIVEAFGCRGEVSRIDNTDCWPVDVVFPEVKEQGSFLLDGRDSVWHKAPSLKLIERPKKKVIKWVTLYKDHREDFVWNYSDSLKEAEIWIRENPDQIFIDGVFKHIRVEFNEEDLK